MICLCSGQWRRAPKWKVGVGGGGGGELLVGNLKGILERHQNSVWLAYLRLHLPQRGTKRKHNFSSVLLLFLRRYCFWSSLFFSRMVGARRIGHGVSQRRVAKLQATRIEGVAPSFIVVRGFAARRSARAIPILCSP